MKALVISFQSLNGESAGGTGRIAYYVARGLHQMGLLDKLVVSSKGKYKTDFPCLPVSPVSKYYLFIINRLFRPLGLPYHKQRFLEEFLFDLFCKRLVNRDVTVIFSTNPYLKNTLQRAQRYGIRCIFFPGNPNENVLNKIIIDEFKKINYKGTDSYSYVPRLNFYNLSMPLFHYIFCSNTLIFDTFTKENRNNVRLLIGFVPPLEDMKTDIDRAIKSEFAVGYLAYSVPLKGLHYLMEIWRRLSIADAKFYVGGKIDDDYQKYLVKEFGDLKNIVFLGHVADINSFFKKISVFVSPSLLDGQPVTVLEAMQRGIPAIVSDACGIKDFIRDGSNGFIYQTDNLNRLEEIILLIKNNPAHLKRAGNMAKVTYGSYSFADYISILTNEVIQVA